jgi:hypothetical protein
MRRRILVISAALLLCGGLSSGYDAKANVPCDGLEVPTPKKKFIGTLWCRQGGNDCIKCK